MMRGKTRQLAVWVPLYVAAWGLGATAAGAQDLPLPDETPASQPSTPAAQQTSPATQPVAPSAESTPPGEPLTPLPEESSPLGAAGRSHGFRNPEVGGPSDYFPIPDRWRVGIPGDYVQNTRNDTLFDPYGQNVLKGDYPILDNDKFLIVTLTSDTLFEARKLPTPSGVSTLKPRNFQFFGEGDQSLIEQNFILSADFFQGDASYRPRDWQITATGVFQYDYVHTNELGVINPDVSDRADRTASWFGPQELFGEVKLADLSNNYDFLSVRAGIQGFTSDFRGFLFSDNEPGIRFFGTYDNNRLQFNLAYFYMLEKDTNTGLNTFNRRNQSVVIANLYRQDFLFPGYTAQLSFHANFDNPEVQFDRNGNLARPEPVGFINEKDVRAYYLGWAGDGHIGRFNISHQFYQALGEESFNAIAGRKTQINAQFFAIELSYDFDWIRYRTSFTYASGDGNPLDGKATGFDSIFDNPNFAGGDFSFFTRQAIRLTGTNVGLVGRNSFFPDLRTSKEEGQANFVNPGLLMYNVGADFDVTPKVKVLTNVSYLQFADPSVLKFLLQDNKVGRDIGIDYSVGLQYRPLLNNNVIFTVGAAALTPTSGFKEMFTSETLYSTFVSATLTY